jgi:hypothetical protein
MSGARVAALTCAGLLVAAAPSDARRLPTPGGRVVVALPPLLLEQTRRAHLFSPLLEPAEYVDAGARLAHPPLNGLDGWRSDVLSALESTSDGKRWRLTSTSVSMTLLAAATARCLATATGASGAEWPARALAAAGVAVSIGVQASHIDLQFDRPVGVVPELLAGCLLEPAGGSPTGPFNAMAANLLAARPGGARGPPLLAVVELRGLGGPADLVGGSPASGSGGALVTQSPDVVLLMQSEKARAQDAFVLKADDGLAAFRDGLAADLLLDVYHSGRGREADGLLPPGLAPARPLPQPRARTAGPLALGTLPATAPRVRMWVSADDALLNGVAERLAVLLRAQGYGLEAEPGPAGELDDGVELLRWRSPTADPALALLSLAGERRELRAATDAAVLADPRLLSGDEEERVAAALELERHWQSRRLVVPLMTAQRWLAVDPGLRGVRLRPDGVPLLDDAWWGGRE